MDYLKHEANVLLTRAMARDLMIISVARKLLGQAIVMDETVQFLGKPSAMPLFRLLLTILFRLFSSNHSKKGDVRSHSCQICGRARRLC